MKFWITTILVFAFSGISAQNSISDYYYPKYANEEPRIYKYVNRADSTDIFYWKVIYDSRKDEMITEGYNLELFKFNYFVEKFEKNGTKVTEFIDYVKLPFGLKRTFVGEIIEDDVFKWNDEREYSYKVNINGQYGQSTLNKKRKFLGFEKITINGKEFDCIKFSEEYKNVYHDHNDTLEFYQITYYSKNLGMVKCTKYFYEKKLEYVLTDILSDEEFSRLAE